jgi:hypothetical protein
VKCRNRIGCGGKFHQRIKDTSYILTVNVKLYMAGFMVDFYSAFAVFSPCSFGAPICRDTMVDFSRWCQIHIGDNAA